MAIRGRIVQNFKCKDREELEIGSVFTMRVAKGRYIVVEGDGSGDDCSNCDLNKLCSQDASGIPACTVSERAGTPAYFKIYG